MATKRKPSAPKRSLQDVVGSETYSVWVNMLRALVPDGRTHRLSVVIAGMLQYAASVADEQSEDGSVAQSLIESTEVYEAEEVESLLQDVVARLFKDAGATYKRTSASGEHYTITESAYEEYIHWFDMPWDA
jgi:hypothetical protein